MRVGEKIYFSPKVKEIYDVDELNFLDSSCFELVFSDTVQIYHSFCALEVQE